MVTLRAEMPTTRPRFFPIRTPRRIVWPLPLGSSTIAYGCDGPITTAISFSCARSHFSSRVGFLIGSTGGAIGRNGSVLPMGEYEYWERRRTRNVLTMCHDSTLMMHNYI